MYDNRRKALTGLPAAEPFFLGLNLKNTSFYQGMDFDAQDKVEMNLAVGKVFSQKLRNFIQPGVKRIFVDKKTGACAGGRGTAFQVGGECGKQFAAVHFVIL